MVAQKVNFTKNMKCCGVITEMTRLVNDQIPMVSRPQPSPPTFFSHKLLYCRLIVQMGGH